MKPASLTGRSVVVIGAASGIGAATARALVRAGARVALADLAELTLPDSERVLGMRADVTRTETLDALRDAAIGAFGSIDAVINCASVIAPGPVDRLPVEAVHRQINVNVL
ncbi:MAG: SDR family NAD(P)-dependent oxidoreductase, partial [Gemmatimonadetes bacterium]|nr:SDR family NAD(P)-dependent oxidoreductase [Gemmatimonadota bacterium]